MRKITGARRRESLDKVRICGKGETMRRSGRKNLALFKNLRAPGYEPGAFFNVD